MPKKVETGLTCLVVDDEPVHLDFTEYSLQQLGHTSVKFLSPLEAERAFMANLDSFDVVVTDKRMPGLNGLQLAERIRAAADTVIVLVSLDGFDEYGVREARKHGIDFTFSKGRMMRRNGKDNEFKGFMKEVAAEVKRRKAARLLR